MIKKYWLLLTAFLIACDPHRPLEKTPEDHEMRRFKDVGSLTSGEGFLLGGGASPTKQNNIGATVNAYLWRACLQVLNFMPLVSADARGGVVVTDWYTQSKNPSERIKVMAEITSAELRVRSLKITVYKQHLKQGQWINAGDNDIETANALENIILTRARQLRVKGSV